MTCKTFFHNTTLIILNAASLTPALVFLPVCIVPKLIFYVMIHFIFCHKMQRLISACLGQAQVTQLLAFISDYIIIFLGPQ